MMVTPYDAARLFATMQTDHSRVAGFLASHWGNGAFAAPEPWNSVVLAAQEHDRGWWLWECCPTLSDAGGPLDYQNETLHHLGELRTTMYRNAVSDIASLDPYAALLILNHLTGLLNAGEGAYSFRKDMSDDPIARTYLLDQANSKQTLLETVRGSQMFRDFSSDGHIENNSKIIEFVDALAQFLCNRYPLSSPNRGKDPNRVFSEMPVPTRPGNDEVRLTVRVIDAHRLVIDPFPFDASPLSVNFVARWLPNRTYASREDFLKDFYRAETVPVQYQVQAS
ncbi:MAG: DUF3891 family protein [Defluviicoccus sp.]|nr:MAG: DUF3891 family protein [Defluviicoccus sp.]